MLPLEPELLPDDPLELGELGVALLLPLGLLLELLPLGLLLEPPLPMPAEPLLELPELPLDEGAAPEGVDDPPAGAAAPGVDEEDELEGDAPGVEEEDDPEGDAPDEDEEDDSPPAAGGVDGVLELDELGAAGVLELLLGVEGVELELELEPGVAEVPELPDSLLQPASSAARMLAASRTLEGWVSFIVRSFSK